MEMSSVPSAFVGKHVFITGGSGFLGRLLIEKLLRSCPEIEKIYLLLRPKRGKSLEQRLQQIHQLKLFEVVNELYPNAFHDKVMAINGDMMELRMGLSDDDYDMLVNNVNIIIHSAATVQFNQPLKLAIFMIIRGAREMCRLALACKHLECFQHVSTCYTNTHESTIYEQLYPAPADWRKCIEIAENLPQHQLQVLMKHFMQQYRNTYVFTKAIAEHVVQDMLEDRVPTIIIRPSIVIGTWKEDPIKGWIDNLNGPVTLTYLAGLGVARIVYQDKENGLDYVPADIVIKGMIVSIWEKLISRNVKLAVYNASNCDHLFRYKFMIDNFDDCVLSMGSESMIWYPRGTVTTNFLYFYIFSIVCQIIPSLIADALLKLFTGKARLLKVQRLLYLTQMTLSPFSNNCWRFDHSKLFALNDRLLKELDQQNFNFSLDGYEWYSHFIDCATGLKLQVFKEKTNENRLRRKIYFLRVLYWSLTLIAYYFIFKFFYNCLSVWWQ